MFSAEEVLAQFLDQHVRTHADKEVLLKEAMIYAQSGMTWDHLTTYLMNSQKLEHKSARAIAGNALDASHG